MPEFRDKWLAIGLSTAPADRPRAEEGIRLAYGAAGLKAPRVVWCGSPLGMGIARGIMEGIAARGKEGMKAGAVESGTHARPAAGVVTRRELGILQSPASDGPERVVTNPVHAQVEAMVRDGVSEELVRSLVDGAAEEVSRELMPAVKASLDRLVSDCGYGQHDACWLGFYDYFREVCGLMEETKHLAGLWMIAQSANWFLPHANVCFVSERPAVLKRDDRGRLHCADGAALRYPDGWSIFAIHGVRLEGRLVTEALTLKDIDSQANQEVKRVLIERFGEARYLEESGAELAGSDDFGTLYRVPARGSENEPTLLCKVVNATAEPDGSFKDYFLRVPPTMLTPRAAVAWTFFKSEADYAPEVET